MSLKTAVPWVRNNTLAMGITPGPSKRSIVRPKILNHQPGPEANKHKCKARTHTASGPMIGMHGWGSQMGLVRIISAY